MAVSNYDITAAAFRSESAHDYELSILIGVDSLCYSIFDNFQQLLGLRKYSYSQPLASFRDLSGPVSEILGVSSDMVRETPRTEEDESTRAINGIIPTGDDMIKILSLEALLPSTLATAA